MSRTVHTRAQLLAAIAFGLIGCMTSSCSNLRTQPDGPTKPAVAVPVQQSGALADAQAKFVDTTDKAGLEFKQSSGGCGMRYFVEQVASGAAVIDVNQDGSPDLYFPQPKPLGECIGKAKGDFHQRLYMNDGHGGFRLAKNAFKGSEPGYGIAAAVGDFDNDGWPDLYVCGYGGNVLYHNNHDGTFTDVTKRAGVAVGGFSTGAVWFDYDNDGKLDLYVMRYCEWSLATDIPCKGPNGERDNCNPQIYTPATNKLYHNNGDGTFTDVTAKSHSSPEKRRSLGAAAVDFDGDGWLDLFVANDLGPNYLLHNNQDGTFSETAMQVGVAVGESGRNQANMGIAVGDYCGNGRDSVLVGTFSSEPKTLYRNEGTYFTDVSEESGIAGATKQNLTFGTVFVDSTNSGVLDLFSANGHVSPWAQLTNPATSYKQSNVLMRNDGTGHFRLATSAIPADPRVHRGACVADFDNDGREDLLVTATDDRPELLHNETPSNAHWLMLRLYSREGCCTPVGTRCTATIKGKTIHRAVIGGGSYGGDSDSRVHFGLADATEVEKLEIRWMSGRTQTLEHVRGDRVITVREPR